MNHEEENTQAATEDTTPTKPRRGFASMSKEQRAEISRKGGRSAHAQGKAHKWNTVTAREAGRKGGAATRRKVATHESRGG